MLIWLKKEYYRKNIKNSLPYIRWVRKLCWSRKYKFQQYKNPISIHDVNIDRIEVSYNVRNVLNISSGKKMIIKIKKWCLFV